MLYGVRVVLRVTSNAGVLGSVPALSSPFTFDDFSLLLCRYMHTKNRREEKKGAHRPARISLESPVKQRLNLEEDRLLSVQVYR